MTELPDPKDVLLESVAVIERREVVLQTESDVCRKHPLWIRFAGSGDDAVVLQASSSCFED